jgi:hypothetical protein
MQLIAKSSQAIGSGRAERLLRMPDGKISCPSRGSRGVRVSLLSPSLCASERLFAFTYEVTTADKGELELENWVTWQFHHGRNGEPNTHEFDFRHELEYGVTDRLQASLYFADWHINDHPGGEDRVHYDDAALEVIYRLSSPDTDFLGSAVYGEIRGGPDFLEFEGKILLQKNSGKWIAAYNAELEGRWMGERLEERAGEFAQSIAVSFEINPRFTVGAEALHEIDIPNWDKADEPSVQTRLITGFEF